MSKIIKITAFFLFFVIGFCVRNAYAIYCSTGYKACCQGSTLTCCPCSNYSECPGGNDDSASCSSGSCTVGTTQNKYTAAGCTYETETRECCSNGTWSAWGGNCPKGCSQPTPIGEQTCTASNGQSGTQKRTIACNTSTGEWFIGEWSECVASVYCAGNANYDYGWFRGECFKSAPFSCQDVTNAVALGGGYSNNELGWGLTCGCPDKATVTVNQAMWTDNSMNVKMACSEHQLHPTIHNPNSGGLGVVNASSIAAATTACKTKYASTCENFKTSTLSGKQLCTASPRHCWKSNSGKNYYHDCYEMASDISYTPSNYGPTGSGAYMCVCSFTYRTYDC